MKFFTNKSIWSKIIIILIFVILFEFVVAKPVQADDDFVTFGGTLVSPIAGLFVALGDGMTSVMHEWIMGQEQDLLPAFEEDNSALGWIVDHILWIGAAVALIFGAPIGLIIGAITITFLMKGLFSYIMGDSERTRNTSFVSYPYAIIKDVDKMWFPAYTLTPEEIFKGHILLFNVDFFSDPITVRPHTDDDGNIQYYYYLDENGEEVKTSNQNSAAILRNNISSWYVGLRNIAIVCMMIVLLYVAIRMLLSLTGEEKAKYVQMFKDWLIGMALLASMHYVMVFANVIVNKITDVVSSSVASKSYVVAIPDKDGEMTEKLEEFGYENFTKDGKIDENTSAFNENGSGDKMICWQTNLMGALRISIECSNYGMSYVGKSLCFAALVLFTVFFVFTYLKRLLYMAFLTVIAPLVALTYPIDKLNDGQAQGFDKWLKEYIFNLLIQPMHLLLYYILITSAFDLAGTNPVYSLVAIGFMMPAEKLLRSFFGFEKASTPAGIGGAAGTALALGAVSKLRDLGNGFFGGSKPGSSLPKGDKGDKNNIRTPKNQNGGLDPLAVTAGAAQQTPQQQNDNQNDDEDNNQEEEQQTRIPQPGDPDFMGPLPLPRPGDQNFMGPLTQEQYEQQQEQQQDQQEHQDQQEQQQQPQQQPDRTPMDRRRERVRQRLLNGRPTKRQRIKQAVGRVMTPAGRVAQKAGRQLWRATKATGAYAGTGVLNTAKKLPRVATTATGVVAGAAVGAMAGTVAAMLTGDPKQVATYLGGGALVGEKMGSGASDFVENKVGVLQPKDAKQSFNKVYNGAKYQDERYDKYKRKYKKDDELKERLKANFDKKKVEEMLKKGNIVDKCLDNGIDDIDDIIAVQRLKDEDQNNVGTDEKAIAYAQMAKRVGNEYNADTDKQKKWRTTFKEGYMKNNMSEDQADAQAGIAMEMIAKYNTLKGNNN